MDLLSTPWGTLALAASPAAGLGVAALAERWAPAEGLDLLAGPRRDAAPALVLASVGVAVWSALALPPLLTLAGAGLGWILLAAAAVDIRRMILPDALTLPLLGAGVALAAVGGPTQPLDSTVGALAGWGALAGLAALHRRLRGRDGLGLGDAKLFAAAGAWVGWQGLPSVALIGALSGLAWVALTGRLTTGRDAPLPFGPFLALGAWLTFLYGPLPL